MMCNGLIPVDYFIEFLYTIFYYANTFSHFIGQSIVKHFIRFPKILFMNLVFPSILKWYEELNYNFMSVFFHKVIQKCPMKLVYFFGLVLFGNSCNLTISLKNKTTIPMASLIF